MRTLIQPTNPIDVGEDLNNATYSADGSQIFYQRWFPRFDPALGDERRRYRSARVRERSRPGWDGVATPSPDGRWIAYWHVHPGWPGDPARHGRPSRWNGPLIETGPALTGTAHWVWSPDSSKILIDGRTMGVPDRPCCSTQLVGLGTTVPWNSDLDLDWQRVRARELIQSRRPTAPFAGQERTPGGRARGSRCMRLGCGERISNL